MSRASAPIPPSRALRNRASDAWNTLFGWPAAVALVAFAIAAALHFYWLPLQQRARTELQQREARADKAAAAASGAAARADAGDPLARTLPVTLARGRDVGALLAAAQRNGLVLDRADYTVEAVSGSPLTRLHANLPVTGSYLDVRRFIADVLNTMPNATLESLQLERPDTQSAQLQATLRIVLFYRAGR